MQSLEAEQRLCAIALHRNEWLEDVSELRPDHFETPAWGALYAHIIRILKAGSVADMASLQGFMKTPEAYESLRAIVQQTSPGGKKAFHSLARTIVETAGRRALLRAVEESLEAVKDAVDSPLQLLSRVEDIMRGADVGSANKAMTMRDAALGVARGLSDPHQRGLSTGYHALDKRIGGMCRGDLIVIAGRPGSGKSSFAMNLARNLGQNGFSGHLASYEMSSQQIGSRIIGALGDLDYSQIRRAPESFNAVEVEAIAATAPDNIVVDPTSAQSLAQLEMAARATRKRFSGLDFILVDYLQLMKGSGRQSAQERVAEVSRELKSLAIRLQVPIIALCQINRAAEARDGNRPQLGDMRESGAIEQDADVVLGLYREAYYLAQNQPDEADQQEFRDWARKLGACKNVLEVITLKNRQGPCGTDKLTIFLERDKIENFIGPVAVPPSRMRRDYE